MIHEAMFWKKNDNDTITCLLCPNHCTMSEGQQGICRVRGVRNGKLYALYYGCIGCGGQIDPMEKKPLYHFYPKTPVLSFGGVGCNLQCQHCQNYTLSQTWSEQMNMPINVLQIIGMANKSNCKTIAWTYNEPTISLEMYYNYSQLLKKAGFRIVWVSNGYIEKEPLEIIAPFIDAANIDIKAFRSSFYTHYTHSQLDPVLQTCIRLKAFNVHVELTYLIIPTLNDSDEEIEDYLNWVKENMGIKTPLHFSRFFPQYKMRHLPPTPAETLNHIAEKALEMGFLYVYTGNISPNPYENTICPHCKNIIIERTGYQIHAINIDQNHCCSHCKQKVDIIC